MFIICIVADPGHFVRFNDIFDILYWGKYNCVSDKKDCKHGEMCEKKYWVEVDQSFLVLAPVRSPCPPSHLDQDGDVEEEGGEDEEDGGEDPDGQRGQTFRVGGGGREDGGEHVHKHLGDEIEWGIIIVMIEGLNQQCS